MKRWVVLALKLSIAAGLVYLLFRGEQDPLASLAELRSGWPWFVAASMLYGAVLFLAAWRWRILLQAQGIAFHLKDATSLTLIGHFFNQFLLGSTGGDVVKAYYAARELPGRRAVAAMTVILDRVLGLVVLILIASVAVLANLDILGRQVEIGEGTHIRLHFLALAPGVLLLAGLVALALFYSPWVRSHPRVQAVARLLPFRGTLKTLSEAMVLYRHRGRQVLGAVVISAGIHIGVVGTNVLFLRCLTPDLPPMRNFLLLVPLAQILMAVPITPASLGTAEAAYDRLFWTIGVPAGLAVSVIQRLTYYAWAVIGGLEYIRRRSQFVTAPGGFSPADPASGPALAEAAGAEGAGGAKELQSLLSPAARTEHGKCSMRRDGSHEREKVVNPFCPTYS